MRSTLCDLFHLSCPDIGPIKEKTKTVLGYENENGDQKHQKICIGNIDTESSISLKTYRGPPENLWGHTIDPHGLFRKQDSVQADGHQK